MVLHPCFRYSAEQEDFDLVHSLNNIFEKHR